MIEKFVQLLIGEIDAQLLKAVESEILKTKNVQDANEAAGEGARVGGAVDLVHKPGECATVKCLGLDMK